VLAIQQVAWLVSDQLPKLVRLGSPKEVRERCELDVTGVESIYPKGMKTYVHIKTGT
jgi:hypothetical protein